jgi:hypothetical protein
MKLYPLKALLACALTVAAAVSAPASGATDAPAPAERFLAVTLYGQSVGCGPHAVPRGLRTLVVRNARASAESFVLARHAGGMSSLPSFYGRPFVPRYAVAARLHGIPAGTERRIAVTLAPGEYFLVATANASGAHGMTFADAGRSFSVS